MILICDNCKNEFNRTFNLKKSLKRKNVFCSKKCHGEFMRLDLTKQHFGEWKVLELDFINKNRESVYKCKCSCGRVYSVSIGRLRNGNSTKCKKCSNRKYIGEISSGYFSSIRCSAKIRKISFEITQDDIWEQFLKQNRKCVYSGLELNWQDGFRGERGAASVDRINNNIGYTKDNIQIIHKHINAMKLNYFEEYFLELCNKVSVFNGIFYPIENYQQPKRKGNWKGHGDISGSYFNQIVNRKIECNITIESVWDIYLNQGGVCALSGIPIKFESCAAQVTEKTASLDRINSLFGYVEGNVQWLHKDINFMKNTHNQNYFINLCKTIDNYQRGKQ